MNLLEERKEKEKLNDIIQDSSDILLTEEDFCGKVLHDLKLKDDEEDDSSMPQFIKNTVSSSSSDSKKALL